MLFSGGPGARRPNAPAAGKAKALHCRRSNRGHCAKHPDGVHGVGRRPGVGNNGEARRKLRGEVSRLPAEPRVVESKAGATSNGNRAALAVRQGVGGLASLRNNSR